MTASATRPVQEPASPEQQVRPPVDILRVDDAIIVNVSLPGLKSGDFRVSLVGDRQVYIEGTARYGHPVPQENLVLAERPYGHFQRTVNLPFPVRSEGVDVRLQYGVLTVRLPIRQQPLPLRWV